MRGSGSRRPNRSNAEGTYLRGGRGGGGGAPLPGGDAPSAQRRSGAATALQAQRPGRGTHWRALERQSSASRVGGVGGRR